MVFFTRVNILLSTLGSHVTVYIHLFTFVYNVVWNGMVMMDVFKKLYLKYKLLSVFSLEN